VTGARGRLVRRARSVHRALGELRSRARLAVRQALPAPTVSVVIPVYNVEPYIDECLLSLRAQSHTALEIIVVDDGSTDGSAVIYRRHASEDPRFVLLEQENAGQGAARNAGVRRATGRYVTFLDPDDVLPHDAYATMVRTLEATGSDFVLGSVRLMSNGVLTSAPWIDQVHHRDRPRTRLTAFPTAVLDVICCNRMLRRSFWESAGIRFPEGVAYEDHVPMMQAYVRARRFDVLRAVTYHWRTRENLTSTGQRKRELQNLRDRLAAKEQAAELLRDAPRPVRDAWLRRVLDLDLHGFVRELETADEEYWTLLDTAVRGFLDDADDEVLAGVRVLRRIQAWLLADGRRAELLDLVRWQAEHPDLLPTEVRDGRVFAALPPLARSAAAPPDRILELGPRESRLMSSVRTAGVDDDGALRLTGWAYPRLVDLTDREPHIEAVLVEADLGLRYELAVTPQDAPEADLSAAYASQSHRRAGFAVRIDPDELVRRTLEKGPRRGRTGRLGRWRLHLTCAVEGVVRTGVVRSDSLSGRGEPPAICDAAGMGVAVVHDPVSGLFVEVTRQRRSRS
jgi:CDP-glycerol glycerophosphotransferase